MWEKIRTNAQWEQWDLFLKNRIDASFLGYSTWLETYHILPFLVKKEGFVAVMNGQIIGGITGVKFGFFKASIFISPAGFVFMESVSDLQKKELIENAVKSFFSNYLKVQLSSIFELSSLHENLKEGKKIKYLYLNPGQNIINLKSSINEQLLYFKSKLRRDINASLRKGLEIKVITQKEELPIVYELFKHNALSAGYSVRNYRYLKKPWEKGLKDKKFIFFLALKDGIPKGALWLIDCGKKLHYVMGGSKKEKPDLLIGYFLQYHAITLSIDLGYSSYNISLGGSEGVKKFKSDFEPIESFVSKNYFYEH